MSYFLSSLALRCNFLRVDGPGRQCVVLLEMCWVLSIDQLRRAILILALGLVALGFSIPRSDVPGTPFDESETPVNATVASVVPAGELVPPARFSVIVSEAISLKHEIRIIYLQTAEPSVKLAPHTLQSLLCTFTR